MQDLLDATDPSKQQFRPSIKLLALGYALLHRRSAGALAWMLLPQQSIGVGHADAALNIALIPSLQAAARRGRHCQPCGGGICNSGALPLQPACPQVPALLAAIPALWRAFFPLHTEYQSVSIFDTHQPYTLDNLAAARCRLRRCCRPPHVPGWRRCRLTGTTTCCCRSLYPSPLPPSRSTGSQ